MTTIHRKLSSFSTDSSHIHDFENSLATIAFIRSKGHSHSNSLFTDPNRKAPLFLDIRTDFGESPPEGNLSSHRRTNSLNPKIEKAQIRREGRMGKSEVSVRIKKELREISEDMDRRQENYEKMDAFLAMLFVEEKGGFIGPGAGAPPRHKESTQVNADIKRNKEIRIIVLQSEEKAIPNCCSLSSCQIF